ncbi:MAG: hypothetical protein BGO07_01390 [Alphaproteobacteria bacterium 40-19]|nr:MAG: hypothetical protein BGO07_01390 [Alphaproteobacteria bacterium 40-19]
MKKINYIFVFAMLFSVTSTASADQIEDLTQKIVKSKEGTSLLETAQQFALKSDLRMLTRDAFRKMISAALEDLKSEGSDLSRKPDELADDIKELIKYYIQTNEADELDIMNREDAIRKNEHRKKKVQKAERAAPDSNVSPSIETPQSFYLEKDSEHGSESSINSDLSAGSNEINPENTSKNDRSSSNFIVSANSAFRKVDQGNTSKSDSNASSTRKSTRTSKANPKYTSDCIGC